MTLLNMFLRLLLAVLMGGLVGLERERHDRPAGLRTHLLVCAGSTLITLVSFRLGGDHFDPGRIAAQIVSGIGFLGAGTIFRAGSAVRGLTTAAGLWVVAGVGMAIAVGGDLLLLGVLTAGLVFATNMWLRLIEDRVLRTSRDVVVRLSSGSEVLAAVFAELDRQGIAIQQVQWLERNLDRDEVLLRLRLAPPAERRELTGVLTGQQGVKGVEWE